MVRMVCLIVLLLLVAASCAVAKEEFLISQWCGPTEFTQESFAEAAGANFNVLMLSAGSPEATKKALDLCQANGVKGMVQDSRIHMRNGRYDKEWPGNLDGVVADYSKHPALWGYYVIDEPSASSFLRVGDVCDYLLGKDPKHIPYVNLFPTYASRQQLGTSTYETYVDQYCRIVHPKIISYDHYALMNDGSLRGDYFENLEIIRRQGIKHHIPFNYILLSIPHGPYRDPSEADLRWQVYTALAYGARGIMYFTYTTPKDPEWNFHNAIIDENGKPTAKYEWVKKINGEVKKLAPTLMKLDSVAVYHTGTVPQGAKPLPEGGLITGISGGEYVIGQFNSESGQRYAMFVNRSFKNISEAKISFSQKVALYEVNPASGREKTLIVDDDGAGSVWSASFAPGEGKLVRIETIDDLPVMHWEDIPAFRPRIALNPSNQFANQIWDKDHKELYNEGMNMYMIAERVQKYLMMDGRVDAFMTRNTQTQRTTLGGETTIAKALDCDALFAFHSDATGTDDPGGGQWTFYFGDEGKRLGTCVEDELVPACRTFYPDMKFMGVRTHWSRLWVLHEGGCPAALTEFLFHTNPKEREMLKDPKCQDVMAKAVAKGILKYFGME